MSSTTYAITPGRYDRDLPIRSKPHFISSTASTNATSLKSSPGSIFNMVIHNTHSGGGSGAAVAFRLYDKATAPNPAVDVPMIIIHIPSNSSKELNFTSGITFTNGIGYAITAGDDVLNATPVDLNGIQLYIGYM